MPQEGRTVGIFVIPVVGLLLLLSAVLQYNDPDPLRWILLYGVAAGVTLGWRVVPRASAVAAIVGIVSLVWGLSMAPGVLPHLVFSDLFREMRATHPAIEGGREMLGLLGVALWTLWLAARIRRERQAGMPR